jgi:hypothetical protein
MSTFMAFTDLYSNSPVFINIGVIEALKPFEASETYVAHTAVYIGERAICVKEPIQAFFQQPPKQEPPTAVAEPKDSGLPI